MNLQLGVRLVGVWLPAFALWGGLRSFLCTLAERGVIQFVALAGSQVVGWCDVTRKPIEGFRHSAGEVKDIPCMALLIPAA